ncbi:DUF502 domain-containing protein [Methylococcus sp. EFPC2]|uniref:DUF502 domain-containing protein n=1 Tax=Methylococcus sp. EFPC2 TaxID=2812648 RepID=UPI001967EB3A|nr:DUF502 domain-containing protein [Methylococcus sp. EFPC2]QSA97473.1 DUF502 domain-containing protein [Methylococcus sp. EFPC2]
MKNVARKYLDYFLLGVLSAVPILVVVQIVVVFERLLRDIFLNVHGYYENYWITGLLFAVTILGLSYFGYRIRSGKTYVILLLESYLEKLPILSTVYRVTKKLIGIFSGDGQTKQREVVYVEYPKDGVWVPAYVTNQVGELFVLYVPTSPNPTSGFTVMVHESKVVRSSMTFEEASSFVISVGVDFPKAQDAAVKLLSLDEKNRLLNTEEKS